MSADDDKSGRGAPGNGAPVPRRRTRLALGLRRDLLGRLAAEESPSQRTLARALGIAVGLVNAHLKRCAADGLIEISGARGRRHSYTLTEAGRTELRRLAALDLPASASAGSEGAPGAPGASDWFDAARASFDRLYAELAQAGKRRVVLCGIDALTEVAVLCSLGAGVQLLGVWRHAGRPVALRGVASILLDNLGNADAVVLATGTKPVQVYAALRRRLPAERIAVPDMLAPALAARREG